MQSQVFTTIQFINFVIEFRQNLVEYPLKNHLGRLLNCMLSLKFVEIALQKEFEVLIEVIKKEEIG